MHKQLLIKLAAATTLIAGGTAVAYNINQQVTDDPIFDRNQTEQAETTPEPEGVIAPTKINREPELPLETPDPEPTPETPDRPAVKPPKAPVERDKGKSTTTNTKRPPAGSQRAAGVVNRIENIQLQCGIDDNAPAKQLQEGCN